MKIGNYFGATFISVLLALIIYDLVVKGLVGGLAAKVGLSGYDDTFNPANGDHAARALANLPDGYAVDNSGQIYRINRAA